MANDNKLILQNSALGTTAVQQPTTNTGGTANGTTANTNGNNAVTGQTQINPATGSNSITGNAGSLINLAGVSDATKQQLGNLVANGYQPSAQVTAAMNELQNVISKQPTQFQSQYYDQLNGIMNRILNREQFQYNPSQDPLFLQYKDQYTRLGKNAMLDTLGQASALTGGYGNSYASTAGNQAYQQYMTQLTDKIPDLYDRAMNRYQMEGDQLRDNYNMLNDAYTDEYNKWNDMYNRWLTDRDYYSGRYDTERNLDYDQYGNMLNYWTSMAGMENDQYNADRAYAQDERNYWYQYVNDLVAHGKVPSDDVLARAGLSWADIAGTTGGSSGGGSSGKKSSGGGNQNGNGNTSTKPTVQDAINDMKDRLLATASISNPGTIKTASDFKTLDEYKKYLAGRGLSLYVVQQASNQDTTGKKVGKSALANK